MTWETQVRRGLREGEVRFLTDDLDDRERTELAIFHGGNGDWYIGVMDEGSAGINQFVRVRTSGVTVHGMPVLVANLYRLLLQHIEQREAGQ